jgi:mycoredoxin
LVIQKDRSQTLSKNRFSLPPVPGLNEARSQQERLVAYAAAIKAQREEFVELYGDPYPAPHSATINNSLIQWRYKGLRNGIDETKAVSADEKLNMKIKIQHLKTVAIILAGIISAYVFANLLFSRTHNIAKGNYSSYYHSGTNVVIYGTRECRYCIRARTYLREHNVAFDDRIIEDGNQAEKELSELGNSAVPVILIGDTKIVGYIEPQIDEALINLSKKEEYRKPSPD